MKDAAVALVGIALLAGLPATRADLSDAEIVALDAVALERELVAGRVSAERVTSVFLRRIEALDDDGPTLGAVIEINPEATAIARRLDAALRNGPVGPLHGLPVLLKANIDTADSMATTAGSLALAMHRASADAPIVSRLRAAGAVVLGKTNLSEWANFRSTRSTSGWSSLGGQTRNPYVLDRNPCGSSSGSAVAVAARLAPLAVGTETDGSIVCPAAVNGVVGIKPVPGSVGNAGIIPIAPRQDVAGPITRTVADARLLFDVLRERQVVEPQANSRPAVMTLSGVRLGVVRDYAGVGRDAGVETAFAQALQRLRAAGAVLIDPLRIEPSAETTAAEFRVLLAEFRGSIEAYLTTVENGPQTLDELIDFNRANAADVMPYFGQELFLAARDSDGVGSSDYRVATSRLDAFSEDLGRLFAQYDLDALVAPANARAWRTDPSTGDDFSVGSSSIAAISGYPSVVVPMTLAEGLPLGLSFVGRPGLEGQLIDIAAAFEQLRGSFPEPRFLASWPE